MPQNTWVCVFLSCCDTERHVCLLVPGFPQYVPENPGDNGTLLTIVREMKRLLEPGSQMGPKLTPTITLLCAGSSWNRGEFSRVGVSGEVGIYTLNIP